MMTFDELIDFSRDSEATFIGSDGLLKTTAASKNLLRFTEEYDNTLWVKTGIATVTANNSLAPNGIARVDLLTSDTSSGAHRVMQSGVGSVGTTHTLSVYARPGTHNFLQLLFSGGAASNAYVTIIANLITGTITQTTAGANGTYVSSSIDLQEDGSYRITMTGSIASGSPQAGFLYAPAATGVTFDSGGMQGFTGTGTTLSLWGSQLEVGSSATAYSRNVGGRFPPRFAFDPATLQPRGLLVEDTRINRTLHSNDFTNAVWINTASGTSTRTNTNNSLGFMRGLITATSAGGGIRQQHTTLRSGNTYALSFYIESSATSVLVTFENGVSAFGSAHSVTINPSNGTAGTLTGFTNSRIVPFQSGYIYTFITAGAGGSLLANIEWRITNSGDSIVLGRPQFEHAGSTTSHTSVTFSSSYIPTTNIVLLRPLDNAIVGTPLFSPLYNQTEGTLVVRFSYTDFSSTFNPNNRFAVAVNDATSANRHAVYNRGLVAQSGLTTIGGLTVASPGAGSTLLPGVVATAAYSYKQDDFHFALDGVLSTAPDPLGNIPANIIRLAIGSTGLGTSALFGCVEKVDYYPVEVTPAQLQQLSLGVTL